MIVAQLLCARAFDVQGHIVLLSGYVCARVLLVFKVMEYCCLDMYVCACFWYSRSCRTVVWIRARVCVQGVTERVLQTLIGCSKVKWGQFQKVSTRTETV